MKTILKVLTLFVGIGAIAGAVMMWADPTGASWGGEPLLEMLRDKMPMKDIFFNNFIPSGFVLLAVNGLPQIAAALLLFNMFLAHGNDRLDMIIRQGIDHRFAVSAGSNQF